MSAHAPRCGRCGMVRARWWVNTRHAPQMGAESVHTVFGYPGVLRCTACVPVATPAISLSQLAEPWAGSAATTTRLRARLVVPDTTLPAWLPDRLAQRIRVTDDGCWSWEGGTTHDGYALARDPQLGGMRLVHRWTWELSGHTIPDGHQLDHLCHDPATCTGGPTCPHRRCANPAHLRACTRAENCAPHRRVRQVTA